MKLKQKLVPYYVSFKETRETCALQKDAAIAGRQLEANIIRQLHGVEKGLCLENPRLGFGIPKIHEMFDYVQQYLALGEENYFCLYMVRDAVQAYLDFHKEKGFSNEGVESVAQRLQWLKEQLPENAECFGGTQLFSKDQMQFTPEQVENLFYTRHSVREFSGEPVSSEDIKRAIALAQMCPSACNRQCSRVYLVDPKKYMAEMKSDLQGIGGFADDAYGFLLVTAKKSAYALGERHQHLVSGAIFAGYLALALHACNIAACTVQRSVSPNVLWERFKRNNDIPGDEQIVLMFAIGKYKEETKVPVSKRFPVDSIYRELK